MAGKQERSREEARRAALLRAVVVRAVEAEDSDAPEVVAALLVWARQPLDATA